MTGKPPKFSKAALSSASHTGGREGFLSGCKTAREARRAERTRQRALRHLERAHFQLERMGFPIAGEVKAILLRLRAQI